MTGEGPKERPAKKIKIDSNLCTGCGVCLSVCPTGTIRLIGGTAVVTEAESIYCGHCEAACPEGAVRVTATDEEMSQFKTFAAEKKWLSYGDYNTSGLVQLMASRRSCRCFTEQAVDRDVLEDLIKIGITAPSGSNSQLWTFTVLPTRKAVVSFAERIADYYERLNKTAENALLRLSLKLTGRGELDAYYHSYYGRVKEALDEWHVSGKDPLFHGSPAVIIIGSRPGGSCPTEDALLATQNILLAAHSIGLGSCLIGFAVASMKKDRSIQKELGIPEEEDVHAVIALGHPAEFYQRPAGRKKVTPRYFEG